MCKNEHTHNKLGVGTELPCVSVCVRKTREHKAKLLSAAPRDRLQGRRTTFTMYAYTTVVWILMHCTCVRVLRSLFYTCRCCIAVVSLTVAAGVLDADVNELLKTIWQCLCVYMTRLCSMQPRRPAGKGSCCGYPHLTLPLLKTFLSCWLQPC